jgi:general secretion pathway protein A
MAVESTDPAPLLAAAHTEAATAWRELALHWNVAIGEGDPCVAAQQARLACFRSPPPGGLPAVRQLARPGVLTLRGADGQARYAVLVGLSERQATLQSAGRSFVLGLPALAAVWRGEFATFWRTPPGWPEDSQRTRWVERQLPAAASASASASASAAQPVRERIHNFQVAEGLPPDGLAGPMTLMRLNRAAGIEEPRLLGHH